MLIISSCATAERTVSLSDFCLLHVQCANCMFSKSDGCRPSQSELYDQYKVTMDADTSMKNPQVFHIFRILSALHIFSFCSFQTHLCAFRLCLGGIVSVAYRFLHCAGAKERRYRLDIASLHATILPHLKRKKRKNF